MAQTFSMFDVLALIAVIVAALGVINTLTMSVLERTREIGMLRGVGMTRWQVVKMILAEAGTVGVMGGVFGVVYGLFMSRLFIGGANVTQGYRSGACLAGRLPCWWDWPSRSSSPSWLPCGRRAGQPACK